MKFPFVLLGLLSSLNASPVINEFVADNTHGIKDQDGSYSDWIEIYNPDPAPVNLAGWYLTDTAANLQKWAFPGVVLNSGQFLVVFASGKNRAVAGAELHTNFSLAKEGEALILSQPGGAGISTQFNPYPPQESDFAYGVSRLEGSADLLSGVRPSFLVPLNAGQLPANWNQITTTGGTWTTAAAPGGLGYDTTPPPNNSVNIARQIGAVAAQSTDLGGYPAANAIDGVTTNFTHTAGTTADANPWWQVTFPVDAQLTQIQLFNRTDCCQGRLRDITVDILDASDNLLWTSPVQNPGNQLNNPTSLSLSIVGLNGTSINGRKMRVNRAGDPSIAGSDHDRYVLSLSEVIATANADINIAPSGTASQSTTAFPAANGNNSNFDDFTHTAGTDSNSTWTLNLNARKKINSVTVHNRTSCCGSRLRDITVTIRDADNTVIYTSPLLNPENQGYAYPNGPANLSLDFLQLLGGPLVGQSVEVKRTADPDLSGTQNQGNGDEANVLSLGEVVISGNEFTSYLQLVPNDVKPQMYNVNSSIFVRWPLSVPANTNYTSLRLRVRHDDGFVAYLDGEKIAERSAPTIPDWNSAATGGERPNTLGTRFEAIDLASKIPLLTAGPHVLAIQGLTSAASDADFLLQPQLFATWVVSTNVAGYLEFATPGGHNISASYSGFVGDTNFSLKRGFYSTPQTVALTCNTPDAQIYYTTNGAEPTPMAGTLYTAPLTLSQTTVLRARGVKTDWRPSNVDTNTYLFLSDVLAQTANPPAGWPVGPVNGQALRYGMNQQVRAQYTDPDLLTALKQVPSISIVTTQANLTSAATGIYVNANAHGEEWERPASIEWLDSTKPAGLQGEFQENCGLRIRGGASRSPSSSKHSLRVYFRSSYGTGTLHYPIFGNLGTSETDVIDLASSQNYSWPSENSPLDTMIRDPFSRMTLLATGSPACRNRYFHLYLNGTYWGLYFFDERPIAGYGEAYFGGQKDDYDAIKTGNHNQGFVTEATDGYLDTLPNGSPAAWRDLWNKHRAFATAPGNTASGNPDLASYFAILGRNADGTRNPALPVLVDVDSLIDYMLVIFYSGDGDAPLSSFLGNNSANNWFALKNRNNPNLGFVFFNHDAEHTFGAPNSNNDRTGPFNGSNQNVFAYSNPQWIFQDLAFSAEFRLRVADRAHKHFFNTGVMTTAKAQQRLADMAAQFNLAVKLHAMRWGSPTLNAATWTNAVAGVNTWMSGREATVVSQLKAYKLTTGMPSGAPLYPATVAPSFSQFGGDIGPSFQLTISAPAGSIYYTLDGTDPRAVGGVAIGSPYSTPLPLGQPATTVKARAVSGGVWSALVEATFLNSATVPATGSLVVSELHYHPAAPSASEQLPGITDGDDFEFLELMNVGAGNLNLTGCYFEAGLDYTFPSTVLAPGARLTLAHNAFGYQTRYGSAPFGVYTGKLSNSGERLWLRTPAGATVLDFTYGVAGGWPTAADGAGSSLVLRQPSSQTDATNPANWRLGASVTPGTGDPGANYPAWKTSHSVTGDTSDIDGDGLPAVLEYAMGTDPAVNSRAALPTISAQSDGTLLFTVQRANLADDATLAIDYRDGLVGGPGWQPAPAVLESRSLNGEIETLTYRIQSGGANQRFVRARFTLP